MLWSTDTQPRIKYTCTAGSEAEAEAVAPVALKSKRYWLAKVSDQGCCQNLRPPDVRYNPYRVNVHVSWSRAKSTQTACDSTTYC
jgi:hypothetical protein